MAADGWRGRRCVEALMGGGGGLGKSWSSAGEVHQRAAQMVDGGEDSAARRSDGSSGLRQRRRLEDGGVALTAEKNRGRGKEWRRRRHEGVRRRLDSFPGLP